MATPIISRQQAQLQGLKRFFTGEPCKRGHQAERFTSNGGCVRCMHFSTPNRRHGPKGTNVGWPVAGFVFQVPSVQLDEMEAAFRMMEANGWHNHCVLEMRKDPSLFEKYRTRLTAQEVGIMEAALERTRRSIVKMQDALVTLACGFGQAYYGPPKVVGDLERCNHCDTDQAIVKIE